MKPPIGGKVRIEIALTSKQPELLKSFRPRHGQKDGVAVEFANTCSERPPREPSMRSAPPSANSSTPSRQQNVQTTSKTQAIDANFITL